MIVRCLSYDEECKKGNIECYWSANNGICTEYPDYHIDILKCTVSEGGVCFRRNKLLKVKIYSEFEYEMIKILKKDKK